MHACPRSAKRPPCRVLQKICKYCRKSVGIAEKLQSVADVLRVLQKICRVLQKICRYCRKSAWHCRKSAWHCRKSASFGQNLQKDAENFQVLQKICRYCGKSAGVAPGVVTQRQLEIFIAFKLNVNFLLSSSSGNHILFLNENTFPNETWHVVRTFVSLQSCVWGMSKGENCRYGGHRNLRYKKNNKNCVCLFAISDIGFHKHRFLHCLMKNKNTVQSLPCF